MVFYINLDKPTSLNEEEGSIIESKALYENSKYGFSLIYPTIWKIVENSDENTVAEFKFNNIDATIGLDIE